MNPKPIITRFPPSPTGLLQAGNVRTAIFNYLVARKNGGKFIVRIEDTDKERSKKIYEDTILETLAWLGLSHDAFSRQSEQLPRHQEVLASFMQRDHAYFSKEEVTEEGQRSEVIRFRNPNTVVTFTDLIRGPISFDTTELGDFVIARSYDEPLYHLGVVIDDYDAGVTHVIRGEDHISNTPRQILLQRALGQDTPPLYAHLPLLLSTDRSKLSKRKGAKAILQYRDEGFLPEAIINYLALLGWHPDSDQELFSIEDLIEQFDLSRVQKGGAVFDEVKLRWFNHEYIKKLTLSDFKDKLTTYLQRKEVIIPPYVEVILPLLKERSQTFKDASDALTRGEFDFMEREPSLTADLLLKGAKVDAAQVKKHLLSVQSLISPLQSDFTAAAVKEAIFAYASDVGRASVLWPLRTALSGKEKSPDPFTLAGLLGKQKTLQRIEQAVNIL